MHGLAHMINVCQFVLVISETSKKRIVDTIGKQFRLLSEPDINGFFFCCCFFFFASTSSDL